MNKVYIKTIMLIFGMATSTSHVFAQQVDVQTFVRQTFVHGVPYTQASQYGSEDATVLLQMLSDPNEADYHANIVVTLAMIGDDRAVAPLINLIESSASNTLSADEYTIKTSALISLGYLANLTTSIQALTYLIDGLQANVWQTRNLDWTSPFHADLSQRNQQMISLSIIGLALSGKPLAREALLTLQLANTLTASDQALIEEALSAHATISSQGLAEYYRESEM